ncbi:hypothetical protein ACVWZV_009303 [Bradyrhizobium sp. GM5.1]|uniref:hypothetical protein n=1 Tax=Bradyrhizobium sp. 156 TaxID=2782630 RepID=UPI001FF92FD1|nr:hypothetical protein [Bradyrhizobium sp. 156]MCK1326400.1 hypothetical protein [Bradyrhizobium sp. 156]
MISSTSLYEPYASANSVGNVLPGGLPLCAIMMLVLMERHEIHQNQLLSEYHDMQARNSFLKDMNKALAALRANRPTDEKTAKDYGTFVDSQGTTQDVFDWMRQKGIPIDGDKRGVQSQFDAAINDLKASIDNSNSEGQMALIYLQGLLDKLNHVAELMSNLLSKDQKIKEIIIGNSR